MSVIPITIFFSLLLAGGFAALFAREQHRRRFASAERDSLLPLADETPRLADTVAEKEDRPLPDNADDHDHAHDHAHADDHDHADDHTHDHEQAHGKGRCGCLDGTRPPCTGCLRRNHATPLTASAPLN